MSKIGSVLLIVYWIIVAYLYVTIQRGVFFGDVMFLLSLEPSEYILRLIMGLWVEYTTLGHILALCMNSLIVYLIGYAITGILNRRKSIQVYQR